MIPPLLSDITGDLAATSDTPALDASVLLAYVLNTPRTWVLAHPELSLTPEQQQQLDNSLARLKHGEPLPYVLGRWEFFGLEFDVTPDVLIPRSETELLVERAVTWLQESPLRRRVADVGTGSGAIAVSIAAHIADAHLLGTDISYQALQTARRNASKFNVADQIAFVQCDLLPLPEGERARAVDMICANLPYIPTETLRSLPVYGREPTLALDGGPDGLAVIRRLLNIAPPWLTPGGMILLEVEATCGRRALEIACDAFPEAAIQLHRDLAGRDRLLEVRLE